MTKQIYCSAAGSMLRISPNGEARICCKMRGTIGNTNDSSMADIFNSEQAKSVRLKLHNGEWPDECIECKSMEEVNGNSWRIERNIDYNEAEHREIQSKQNLETGEAVYEPKYIEIAFSNLCNLACKMCQPNLSTTFASTYIKTPFKFHQEMTNVMQIAYKRESFFDELREALSHSKYFCVTGGEPFISVEFFDFMESLPVEVKNRLFFATTSNMTKSKYKGKLIYDWLSDFEYLSISASIEGPKHVQEYVRYPCKYEEVMDNFANFVGKPNVFLSVNITISALTILTLPETIMEIVNRYDPHYMCLSVVWNSHLTIACLPAELREQALAKIRKFIKDKPYAGARTEETINGIANLIQALPESSDANHAEFMEFVTSTDKTTGQSIYNCIPELRKYIK